MSKNGQMKCVNGESAGLRMVLDPANLASARVPQWVLAELLWWSYGCRQLVAQAAWDEAAAGLQGRGSM